MNRISIGSKLLVVIAVVLTAFLVGAGAAAADGGRSWSDYSRPAKFGVVTQTDVPITMRDGTVLYADVRRPDVPGKYPVIVNQTAYNKTNPLFSGDAPSFWAKHGYVHVYVDVRGTGSSQGTWDAFGKAEQRDGYDVVEWAAKQPFSNGKVGLEGASYMAITQMITAAQQPPHLKAMFPVVPMADGYRDIVFSGGDINTSFIPLWLGLVTAGSVLPSGYTASGDPADLVRGVTTLLSHLSGALNFQVNTILQSVVGDEEVAYDSPFWKTRSPLELVDRIEVPTFVVGGLHDIFQRGEPLIYERLRRNGIPARLLIGPWNHVQASQGAGLPADGVPSLQQVQLRWFDYWLKGIKAAKVSRIPQVTQYAYGREHYETASSWPDPKLKPQTLYLRGGKRLDAAAPQGDEQPQSFVQNPIAGICTVSLEQWTAGLAGGLPCSEDERLNELLSGGAHYTTPVLHRDVHVSGPLNARIWLATTASDAAVTVRVSDVAPDGTVRPITNGWQTASLRATDRSRSRHVAGKLLQPWHPFTAQSVLPVHAGEPTKLDVEVFPTDAVFEKGHRLRVTVDPADFPHQLPPLLRLTTRLAGQVSILTDPEHASSINLPVVGERCAKPKPGGGCKRLPVPRT